MVEPARTRCPDATQAIGAWPPDVHEVLGTPLRAVPRGRRDGHLRHGLLLGRRADLLGSARACTPPLSATPAGSRPTPPTRRSAADAPATPRSCSSPSTPPQTSYEEMLRLFWEGHDPTQGMRQGNDVGTQYRSLIMWQRRGPARRPPRPRCSAYQQMLSAAGHGDDHHRARRDRRRASVLLRRGLPPAVPRQEPRRLLRPRRHRRRLPHRPRRAAVRRRARQPRTKLARPRASAASRATADAWLLSAPSGRRGGRQSPGPEPRVSDAPDEDEPRRSASRQRLRQAGR